MKRISKNIWEHKGQRYEARKCSSNAYRGCRECDLTRECDNNADGSGEFGHSFCPNDIPTDYHFKKLAELKTSRFKCIAVGTRPYELLDLLESKRFKQKKISGLIFFIFDTQGKVYSTELVADWLYSDATEIIFPEAIKLLTEINKPEPEPIFDIQPFDKVLVRIQNKTWAAGLYSHIKWESFCTGGIPWEQLLRYEGNEKLCGTTDTPEAWWEINKGEPTWINRN